MTEADQFELVGRKRAEYPERKKELAALRAKATELANAAETVAQGLKFPEMIRWWDGTPPSIAARKISFSPLRCSMV